MIERTGVIPRERVARFDWPLFVYAVVLCLVGLLNVYSGTRS